MKKIVIFIHGTSKHNKILHRRCVLLIVTLANIYIHIHICMYVYMYVYICISLGHYKQNTTAMQYFVVFGCTMNENHNFFHFKGRLG